MNDQDTEACEKAFEGSECSTNAYVEFKLGFEAALECARSGEAVGTFDGEFGIRENGKMWFKVRAYDAIPAVNSKLFTHSQVAEKVNEKLLNALDETQRDLTILLGNIFASSQHDKNWQGMYDVVNGWITRNHKVIEAAEKLKDHS